MAHQIALQASITSEIERLKPIRYTLVKERFSVYSLVDWKPTKLGFGEFVDIAARLLAAVEELHKNGIVHSDLKPSSFFIRASDRFIKLGDYGSLVSANYRPADAAASAFVAPERLIVGLNEYCSEKADVFGLGVTFMWLCAGRTRTLSRLPMVLNAEDVTPEILRSWLRGDQMRTGSRAGSFMILRQMCERDPLLRPSIQQVKDSALFSKYSWVDLENRANQEYDRIALMHRLPAFDANINAGESVALDLAQSQSVCAVCSDFCSCVRASATNDSVANSIGCC